MERKQTVLIVDDDPEILTQLGWALGDEFDLSLAGSRAEAEALIEDGSRPLAALIDLHLPPDCSSAENGIACIRYLKERLEDVRIIAFSAFATEENEALCQSAGAEMLLSKPVERDYLLRVLRVDS
jgi:two-component system NtrC family response regulator